MITDFWRQVDRVPFAPARMIDTFSLGGCVCLRKITTRARAVSAPNVEHFLTPSASFSGPHLGARNGGRLLIPIWKTNYRGLGEALTLVRASEMGGISISFVLRIRCRRLPRLRRRPSSAPHFCTSTNTKSKFSRYMSESTQNIISNSNNIFKNSNQAINDIRCTFFAHSYFFFTFSLFIRFRFHRG